MNPKIRDVIKRRIRWRWLAFGVTFGLVAFIHFSSGRRPELHEAELLMALAAVSVLAMITGITLTFSIKCPKCGHSLRGVAYRVAQRRSLDFCPYCGVSLNEPASHKLIS